MFLKVQGKASHAGRCYADGASAILEIAHKTLAIDTFLERLPADKRRIFVCRYWYFDPVSKIASRFGMTENHVSVTLNRLRLKLHNYLQERGFDL